jgi:hypothetical protein
MMYTTPNFLSRTQVHREGGRLVLGKPNRDWYRDGLGCLLGVLLSLRFRSNWDDIVVTMRLSLPSFDIWFNFGVLMHNFAGSWDDVAEIVLRNLSRGISVVVDNCGDHSRVLDVLDSVDSLEVFDAFYDGFVEVGGGFFNLCFSRCSFRRWLVLMCTLLNHSSWLRIIDSNGLDWGGCVRILNDIRLRKVISQVGECSRISHRGVEYRRWDISR